jgi:catechol 2,3-dioxygenase-like lactoylglutathione lyase family enzyme
MKIAKVTLNTNDIEANRRFYLEFMGLKLLGDHGGRMLVLDGNLNIDSGHGNPPTTSAHIMLLADDPQQLKSRGEQFGYPVAWEQETSVMFKDPDGRLVEVMATSRWEELTKAAGNR